MAIVRVLPGFGKDVKRGDTSAVQILVEGSNSNTASLNLQLCDSGRVRFAADRLNEVQRQWMVAPTMVSRDGAQFGYPEARCAA